MLSSSLISGTDTYFSVNTLFIQTPKDPSEQTMTFSFDENQREFIFDVTACEQAEIRLLSDVTKAVIYEVIIGGEGNMKTKVYKSGITVLTQV